MATIKFLVLEHGGGGHTQIFLLKNLIAIGQQNLILLLISIFICQCDFCHSNTEVMHFF